MQIAKIRLEIALARFRGARLTSSATLAQQATTERE